MQNLNLARRESHQAKRTHFEKARHKMDACLPFGMLHVAQHACNTKKEKELS